MNKCITLHITHKQQIAYKVRTYKIWVGSAKRDWKTVQNMFSMKDYIPALFFSHLHLEKYCKALWVKNNHGNTPPKIHNLIKILDEAKIPYTQEQKVFMIIMNNFQLEGRVIPTIWIVYTNCTKRKIQARF